MCGVLRRYNRALRLTTALTLGSSAALGPVDSTFPVRTDEVLGANIIDTIICGGITLVLMLAGIGVSAFPLVDPLPAALAGAGFTWTCSTPLPNTCAATTYSGYCGC